MLLTRPRVSKCGRGLFESCTHFIAICTVLFERLIQTSGVVALLPCGFAVTRTLRSNAYGGYKTTRPPDLVALSPSGFIVMMSTLRNNAYGL